MVSVKTVEKNPYAVLGVAPDASQDDIRVAYRRLALQYHPDRNAGNKEAEERFKELSEAYALLREPQSRERFDRFGSSGSQSRPDFSTVDWQSIFREADININWGQQAETPKTGHAVFDFLFGAVSKMMQQNGLLPGDTRELNLTISLAEALRGAQKRVHIPGPSICSTCLGRSNVSGSVCERCKGTGIIRGGDFVDLRIPARIQHGRRLRLRGLGGPGSPPGDALVTVAISLPAHTHLVGQDVHTEVYVTPLEASQGLQMNLFGVELEIPKGTRDNQVLHVVDAGLGTGHLIVTVKHHVWKGVWRRIRGLAQAA